MRTFRVTSFFLRDDEGITRRSLAAFRSARRRIGKITAVSGRVYQGCLSLRIDGPRGAAIFSGLTLGYGGEGPAGSVEALRLLGLTEADAIRLVALNEPWAAELIGHPTNPRRRIAKS